MEINESQIDDYVVDAKDAAIFSGLMHFCSTKKSDPDYDLATYMGFTLLPSPFPKVEFDFGVELAKHWNRLMHTCANDHELLRASLQE